MADVKEIKEKKARIPLTSVSKDLIVLGIISALVFILSYFFDVFVFLVKFFQKHPHSITYVDEIVTSLLTLSIGFAVFSRRRWLELRKETAQRIRLQEELVQHAKTEAESERIISRQLHAEIEQRKEAEEKLKKLASNDELTGCVNFRMTMELLENEIARSRRYQKQFTIVMIDIDHFKRINDDYGHLAGNDALIAFSDILKKSVRNIDTVGRYGGEEFLIILPESGPNHALVALERIRSNLKKAKITSPHLKDVKELILEFSAGIAVFPYNAKDLKELIWVADSALLTAKREGKNRTVIERRRFLRLNPMPGTRIEVIDPSGKETVKGLKIDNISKEGMLFLSTQDIHNEDLLCRIYCPKGKSPFQLTCKVKYKGKAEGELYRIGVYFADMPENIRERLSSCVEPPKEPE